jgi:uncharacterized membrane protein YtjA (UPF0391 family)
MAWALLSPRVKEGTSMLSYALTFFIIALIAAALGLGGVAGLSADIGWLFAVIGVILLIASMVTGAASRRGPPVV